MRVTEDDVQYYRSQTCQPHIALIKTLRRKGGTLQDSVWTVMEYLGRPCFDHAGRAIESPGLCGDEEREWLAELESRAVEGTTP